RLQPVAGDEAFGVRERGELGGGIEFDWHGSSVRVIVAVCGSGGRPRLGLQHTVTTNLRALSRGWVPA
ncbi:MAG: hypothetical protein Q8M65_08745, partial [Rhodoglobus sp.]|nr:hypothetical protein [Rhodoglobus sp.]